MIGDAGGFGTGQRQMPSPQQQSMPMQSPWGSTGLPVRPEMSMGPMEAPGWQDQQYANQQRMFEQYGPGGAPPPDPSMVAQAGGGMQQRQNAMQLQQQQMMADQLRQGC